MCINKGPVGCWHQQKSLCHGRREWSVTCTAGEDAHFVSSYGRGAFGVADGVGGWNVDGVDPSRYSRYNLDQMFRNCIHRLELYMKVPMYKDLGL